MKKLLVLFCVVCALTFVYGCGDKEEPAQPASAPTTNASADAAPAADAAEEAADAAEEAADAAEEAADAAEEAADAAADFDANDPFKNQGAITQADVDAYIKAIPQITASAGDEAKIMAIYKEAGWDEWRGAYVLSKVGTAYAVNMNPDYAEMVTGQLPESLKPSQAEIDLVKKSQDKITKALMGQ